MHHIQSDYTTFFGDKVKSVATYTTLSNEEDGIVHGMKYVVNDLL